MGIVCRVRVGAEIGVGLAIETWVGFCGWVAVGNSVGAEGTLEAEVAEQAVRSRARQTVKNFLKREGGMAFKDVRPASDLPPKNVPTVKKLVPGTVSLVESP